ncbi:hypothetical protein LSPH24S_00543 [Lysinibacillus sphaericus]
MTIEQESSTRWIVVWSFPIGVLHYMICFHVLRNIGSKIVSGVVMFEEKSY